MSTDIYVRVVFVGSQDIYEIKYHTSGTQRINHMESILLIILVSLVGALRWALEEHRISGLARDEYRRFRVATGLRRTPDDKSSG